MPTPASILEIKLLGVSGAIRIHDIQLIWLSRTLIYVQLCDAVTSEMK